jgi:hypothetical protein
MTESVENKPGDRSPRLHSALNVIGTLLSSPSRRCTGTSAENEEGKPVWPWDEKACKWCLTGAITHTLLEMATTQEDMHFEVDVETAIRDILELNPDMPLPSFWDNLSDEYQQKVANILVVVA